MTHNHELFCDYNQFPTPMAVCGIGLGEHLAYGQATLHIGSLHNGLASNEHHLEHVWYVPEMDINIISKSWTKRCGLKLKMNENEDFLIVNDKGMCLQAQDNAVHSYIMNLFVQPFHSHAIVHAGVASEPQSMDELWHRHLGHMSTKTLRILGYNALHNALFASKQSRCASLSTPIQSEQDQRYSVCTPTSVVLSIHQPMMECGMF
jgi:Pol polyprotein, beta-barrel domain